MRKLTVEECEQISIFTVVWQLKYNTSNNEMLADKLLNLSQKSMTSEFAGLPHLRLLFTTTKCHFGGVRYWFLCPSCSKRVGKLYSPLSADEFKCRHCHSLTYKSSQSHNQRVYSLSKQLDDIYVKEGDEALTQAIRKMQRTRRGTKLFWKVYDKRSTPSPFLARKQREEEVYNKYVRLLLES